jgi:hypothetical protein
VNFFIETVKDLLKRAKMPQIAFESCKVMEFTSKNKNRLNGRYNENYGQRLTFRRILN